MMIVEKAQKQIAAVIRKVLGDTGKPVPLDLEDMLTEESDNWFGARFSKWCSSLSREENTKVAYAIDDYINYLTNREEDLKDRVEALERQGREIFPELRDFDFKRDFGHYEEDDEEGDEEEDAMFDDWLNWREEESCGEEREQNA